ncbi:MAG: malate dehydrogenase, partial [Candidatus Hydrothermarchaeaceae archaeon]
MKISVIGTGQVGSTIAYTLLTRKLPDELVLIDVVEEMVKGEALDLRQGQAGIGTNVKITGSTDYSLTEGSDIIIITAGVGRKPGDSRLDLAKKNSKIMKGIIEKVKENKDSILFIVSNPVD